MDKKMDPILFRRVPPEVWTIVLEYLEPDPWSLFNVFRAEQRGTWCDLLVEDRTRFLFPLVTPFLRDHLSPKDLLLCRTICKTWRKGVNAHLSAQFRTPSKYHHESESEWFQNSATICTTFQTCSKINSFLAQLTNQSANPFPSKAVKLFPSRNTQDDAEELTNLYRRFTEVLIKFGNYIHTLILYCDGILPECNLMLKQVLVENKVPNLQCLTIHKVTHWADEDEPNYQQWKESTKWMKYPHRFSTLKDLRALNLVMGDSTDILHNSLLSRYSSQLTQYQTDLETIRSLSFFQHAYQHRDQLRNVKYLKVSDMYGDSSILDRLSTFNLPQVEGLYFNYTEVGRRANNLRSILKLINRFSTTLTEVKWPFNLFAMDDTYPGDYGGTSMHEFWEDVEVKLEKVEWMGIPYCYVGYSILDLLLEKTPKLKHLHITNFDLEYCDELMELEELHEQTDHFWEKLKHLKKLTVEKGTSNVIVFSGSRELCEYRKRLRTYSPLAVVLSDNEDSD